MGQSTYKYLLQFHKMKKFIQPSQAHTQSKQKNSLPRVQLSSQSYNRSISTGRRLQPLYSHKEKERRLLHALDIV